MKRVGMSTSRAVPIQKMEKAAAAMMETARVPRVKEMKRRRGRAERRACVPMKLCGWGLSMDGGV